LHRIEEILSDLRILKHDFQKSSEAFKQHNTEEKEQFKKLTKGHEDLITVISTLTTAIEVYGG